MGKLEEKFVREAKRLFNMQHFNIVRVSDIIQENGTSYYVMDYISGRSLQSIIDQEGPLPEARALKYIGQVMDALEYVHGENMLHLDIKPDNIMIDGKTDRAILIDFGVSKQYEEADGHNTSTIMGQTPGYAPPEQAGNSIRQFTPAADIYALGATLYAALTGITPPSSTDIMCRVARLQPLPAATSAATQAAIGRMMRPIVTNRPQTVAAARALLKMENGELKMENAESVPPVPPTPPTPPITPNPHETSPLAQSHETKLVSPSKPKPKKWLWAAIAAAAIAIGAIAYFLIPSGTSSQPEEPIAQSDTTEIADPAAIADNLTPIEEPDPDPLPAEEPVKVPVNAQRTVEPVSTPAPQPAASSNPLSGYEKDHEWLDMGTSVKWATTNVGSSTPEGYGSYFAWGETKPAPNNDYSEENCRLYGNSSIGSIAGRSGYDAARANWGGNWRMPTKEEFKELIDKCTWTWYGSGMKVTAKNGNVLYFPATGYRYGTSLGYAGEYGYYWSATPDNVDSDSLWAWFLGFYSGNKYVDSYNRSIGRSVRPVLE